MKSMLDQERARSFPRARPRLSAWVVAALFPAALAASCAQGESGETTDTSGSSGDGGAGGGDVGVGGAGGNASSSSSSSASSSSSSSASSSASSSSSSASSSSSSSSSSGGGAGQGGAGGGWMPPVGTADYPLETEQNNLKATADPLAQGTKGFTASIHPLGDIDTFSVFVTPAGSSLRVTIGDGMGGCPLGADLYVRVFGPGGLIATQFGGCPDLTPANFLALSALPEGTYYAQVESANISEVPFYTVDLSILTPGCGDALVQAAAGEECDDANAVMGDGCFDCKLELNLTPEMESNNTAGMANSLNGFDGAKGSIDPIGDVDYFSFEVTVPGSSANIEISDGLNGCPSGFDSIVYLYNPGGAELASDDDGGVSPCSHISPAAYPAATNLPIGTYTVAVHDLGDNDLQSFYVLEVSVNPPGCGDGLLSGGEQCDDGNMTAGDGCDASCMAEAPWEVEPNNTSMTATPLWAGFSSWRGAIQPVGDVDYFVFNYPGGGAALTLETHDIGSSMSCGYDTVIHLLSSNGQEIVQDDDDGEIPCSKLSPLLDPELVNLPAGTYYVWVQRFMDSDPIPGYELTLTIQ